MLYVLEDDVLGRLDRCACDRWLQVDCAEDCITDCRGNKRYCPYCLDGLKSSYCNSMLHTYFINVDHDMQSLLYCTIYTLVI